MKTEKLNWKKLPSVTRPGKSFYRTTVPPTGPTWTVSQSWTSGRWCAENNENQILANTDYTTAKEAMRAVLSYYRLFTL